ncbi:MAG: PepSY domain-containing protein, partial [Acidimicrobiia bacterium]
MKTRTKIIISGAAVVALTAAGATAAISSDDDDGTEVPITGVALEEASRAALDHTGGGTVVETEVGDEESYYEVEVRKLDGSSVDVQLDEQF